MAEEEASLLHTPISKRLMSTRAQLVAVVVILLLGFGAVGGCLKLWTSKPSKPCLCTTSTVEGYAGLALKYPKNASWDHSQKCRDNAKVLGFEVAHFGGLVNQFIFLGQALAKACQDGNSMILDVWTMNMLNTSMWLPQFKSDLISGSLPRLWSDIVDYSALNDVLASVPGCEQTRVEPQRCARAKHVACPYKFPDFKAHRWFKSTDMWVWQTLLWRLPLKIESCVPRDKWPYHAIHLNLDVDWVIVSNRGIYNPDYLDYLKMSAADRDKYSKACCSSTGFYAEWAKRVSLDLAAKVAQLPDGPLFIATSIGKPGYTALNWLLADFKMRLNGRQVLECLPGSESGERELNAVRELATVSAASSIVIHEQSTFSRFACRRVQAQGGICYHGFGDEKELKKSWDLPLLDAVRSLHGRSGKADQSQY